MSSNQVAPAAHSSHEGQSRRSRQAVEQVWMPKPAIFRGCPPGLEYLTRMDQVIVKQMIHLIEVFTSYEEENVYRILNKDEEQVYFAKESSEWCERQMCGGNRAFEIRITDNLGMEVLTVEREFQLCNFTNWCAKWNSCADKVKVLAGGHTIGYVRQRQSFCDPCYVVTDEDENELFYIEGPCYLGWFRCPCEATFKLTTAEDGSEVGSVKKLYTDVFQECCTHANDFEVNFPMDLDVKAKAVIVAATFLIDFMYFERNE